MRENLNHPTLSFTDLAESVAASGLVVEERLLAVLSSAGGDLDSLAKQLVAQGLLTQFQLSALRDGRGSTLRIGNYDLLDRLGAGGMGTVFKARHRRMKREVALKVLAASLSDNQVFVKRFQREVETIACLGHPNVVMAYDADEAEVGHFLVMEFVPGNDLARCVQDEGPFPLARAVNCMLQAARGLAYAHAQGIIHRDVKPHNLLLDPTGVVKVTDLGLARLNHGADGPAEGTDVTMAGGVIGTADYMSPEQAVDSTTIDHRADIYSLGCTMYFLLGGRPPYSGPTFISILLKHRDAEIPSLGALRPETPPSLEELFRCMLAKKTEHRPQSMAEVVRQLEEIATELPFDQAESLHGGSSTTDLSFVAGALANSTIDASGITDQTLGLEGTALAAGVLVVEPSRVQASIIGSYLTEISMSLAGTAPNGGKAIELIRRLRPQAVVSAMHLPDVDGLELAQQIRLEFNARAPGFVLITSEDSTAEASARHELHRVVLLHKPFTPTQLQQALRRVTGESTDFEVFSSDLESWAGKAIDRRGLRVLIVDDSATARAHVRTVLQGLGFANFVEVPDGADAIAVASRENCDLVVTDYNMPLMDGRALVSYFKQNQATARIPILMVTSETNPRLLDAVRQLGVVAIVEKAFPANVVGPLLESLF